MNSLSVHRSKFFRREYVILNLDRLHYFQLPYNQLPKHLTFEVYNVALKAVCVLRYVLNKMKSIWAFAVFAVLAQFPNLADAQIDRTREPGASGGAVVTLTVNLIRQAVTLRLPDDKELLRRIALVETWDGTDKDTYRDNYHGGIWQVDEDMFDKTQLMVGSTKTSRLAANIQIQFGVDWQAITWEDLRKPLYSGLAASLFLSDIKETIPHASDVEGQAKYWKTYYDLPSGPRTEEEFVAAVLLHHDRKRRVWKG